MTTTRVIAAAGVIGCSALPGARAQEWPAKAVRIIDSLQNQMPFLKANRVRAIALAGAKRLPLLPILPTLTESGVSGADIGGWYAMLAPAGTPRPIIDRLYGEMLVVFKSSDLRERYEAMGSEVVLNTPEQFAALIKNEIDIWTKVARDANVKTN
jgi:tripartite-type tricarboxylate transporter receptor subunit TctC